MGWMMRQAAGGPGAGGARAPRRVASRSLCRALGPPGEPQSSRPALNNLPRAASEPGVPRWVGRRWW